MIPLFASLGGDASYSAKSAGFNLAGTISNGMSRLGGFAERKGVEASRNTLAAAKDKLNIGRFGPANDIERKALEVASNTGQRRASAGRLLSGAGGSIAASPRLQNGINIGGGAVAGGGLLYGSNRMGHSSGLEEGVDLGVDAGMQAGVEAAQQNAAYQPQPGYLGGLWNAVKGEHGGGGFNAVQTYEQLSNARQDLIKKLVGRI